MANCLNRNGEIQNFEKQEPPNMRHIPLKVEFLKGKDESFFNHNSWMKYTLFTLDLCFLWLAQALITLPFVHFLIKISLFNWLKCIFTCLHVHVNDKNSNYQCGESDEFPSVVSRVYRYPSEDTVMSTSEAWVRRVHEKSIVISTDYHRSLTNFSWLIIKNLNYTC